MNENTVPGLCWWERWPCEDPEDDRSFCGHPKGTGVCGYCDFEAHEMTQRDCPFFKEPEGTPTEAEEVARQYLEYTEPRKGETKQ